MAGPKPRPEGGKTSSNPALLVAVLAIVIAAFVAFLLLKPRPTGATGEQAQPASAPVTSH